MKKKKTLKENGIKSNFVLSYTVHALKIEYQA